MASYQSRQRDPLFDSKMQAAIERRGKELLGIVLLLIGAMAVAMIASYSPDDPSWISATDAPVQNWMGRFGATLAAPLFMIIGWAAWGLALVALGWGARFALHAGEERAIGRLIFFPIAIAVSSLYAATISPPASWTHSFGLGGLFGDTVLAALLNLLPFGAATGLRLLALLSGFGALALLLFVTGFTRPELRRIGRFLLGGTVFAYAILRDLTVRGARGAGGRAAQWHHARQERKATADEVDMGDAIPAAASPAAIQRAEPVLANAPRIHAQRGLADDEMVLEPVDLSEAEPEAAPGLFTALRRKVMPVLPQPELVDGMVDAEVAAPDEDRLRARISDAVQARLRKSPDVQTPLTKGRGRRPEPLVYTETPGLPPEPPLTAGAAAPAAFAAASDPFAEAVEAVEGGYTDDHADGYDHDPYDSAAYDMDEDHAATAYGEEAQTPAAPARAPQMQVPVPEPRRVVQNPGRKPVQPSARAQAEAQPALRFEDGEAGYEHPPLDLLMSPAKIERHVLSDEALEENARMLENVLDDYGVKGEIVSVRPGPVVTMYELEPAPGLKASRVIGLADDIARSMSALSARVSTVPGRSVIGIELPNEKREMVALREILSTRQFDDANQRLPLALGKDIGGAPVVANLAKMPHLLIAGTTGSGKSVAINTMILSLLYKLSPEECRLIMIDPKMLELSVYDGIPHLLSPVVTDPKKAVVALKWVVGEMEERYRKMSKMGVRNIEGYNGRVRDALGKGEMFSRTVQTGFDDETGDPVFETEEFAPELLPFIVVIVDEMADLMMVAGKEIEACIQRLAQMARASGIHLIMATQRPSVDVITGTIKANFPTRISFQVTSKIDSRTILGEQGAEQLLGMGDMLYMAGGSKITRVHGPFCSDEEVEDIVTYLKDYGPPEYVGGVLDGPDEAAESDIDLVLGLGGNTNGEDALYDQAVAIVIKDRKCSTSYIQRKLGIGYNKAARLVEQMEEESLVSPANHVGKREILVPEQ
ncbi:DNA translocase FtsK [Poseidonocella sedimentorum]|uniref:DNA translocase FtsK n=1 Tax=Poseidonocella sedimentorum TaxID=871652 RepID=A0A1I6E9A1_9RHOB|nr:DNA translocase FtsK [Poseidonocella sedimentorum]SFR14333.1 DNA segregation ATPase FtsK/SpoIIIE, S-DNA-T family [Poseidonocella sedimentorum]